MIKLAFRTLPLLIIIIFVFQGCHSPEKQDHQDSASPFADVPEIEAIQIRDITDENATSFYFASNYFHHLSLAADGSFFVSNRGNKTIYQFNQNGEYLNSIGQEGPGPGEFQIWPTFDTSSEDTLYALDKNTSRVSRFILENGKWNLDADFELDKKDGVSPEGIFSADQDKLLIEYPPSHSTLIANANNNVENYKVHSIYTIDGELIKDNWLQTPYDEKMVYKMVQGASVTMPLPYASETITKVGQDAKVYHTWTRDFNLKIFKLGESLIDSISFKSNNTILTEELRQQALDSASLPYMGTDQEQEKFKKALFDEIPTTAPALSDMHVDRDSGNIIVRRFTFGDEPNWMLLNKSGDRVGVFRLDEKMEVFDFRNRKIIGTIKANNGFPAVRLIELAYP